MLWDVVEDREDTLEQQHKKMEMHVSHRLMADDQKVEADRQNSLHHLHLLIISHKPKL